MIELETCIESRTIPLRSLSPLVTRLAGSQSGQLSFMKATAFLVSLPHMKAMVLLVKWAAKGFSEVGVIILSSTLLSAGENPT